ncbi:MAG: RnfABCDGE type electron transport complex subunit D [Lawsonibacter sp.]|nr:RnfABCDGE type electron transport complex subunit D [Lawsonibacter sp.]
MNSHPSAGRVPPQLARTYTTRAIMRDVLVALIPSLGMSVFLFGPRVLSLTAVSVVTCLLSEYLYRRFTGKNNTLGDLSACVTGLLLAMCLPVTASYWAPVLGGVFAIVVVKQLYGGLGGNFMNPALAGRMLLCTFPHMMTTWSRALDWVPVTGELDAVSSATPMSYLHNGVLPPLEPAQMLLGQHGGSIGEVSVFMLLLGGIYLLLRGVITLRIPLSFLGTVAVLTFLTPRDGTALAWMTAQLCSGGLVLGAIFMATDYTTSPVTPRGQVLYGVGCGALTVLLRSYGSYPDGVGWAILTMNCVVWLLDRAGMPRRFGVRPLAFTRRQLLRAGENLSSIKFVVPKWRLPAWTKGKMPGEEHLDEIRRFGQCAACLGGSMAAMVLLVSLTHTVTDLDIARRGNQAEQAILAQAMPAAEIRTETPYRSPDAVSISAGYAGSELLGYCIEVQTPGFGGVITMVVGVDLNGTVTGVAVTGHKETLDMGTQALDKRYLDRFIGRSGTLHLSGPNSVDIVSGATVTSKAVITAVNRALSVAANLDTGGDIDYTDGDV